MLFVSRQHYYYSGESVVEVETQGGSDYAGADMLVPRYDGEGTEYADPCEAIETAIKVRDAWRKDSPDEEINIGIGSTHGMGMEFEASDKTDDELREWARKFSESLTRCDRCGDILEDPDKYYFPADDPDFGKFCSSACCENEYYDYLASTCPNCSEGKEPSEDFCSEECRAEYEASHSNDD